MKKGPIDKYYSVFDYFRNYILNEKLKQWKEELKDFDDPKFLSLKLDKVILE